MSLSSQVHALYNWALGLIGITWPTAVADQATSLAIKAKTDDMYAAVKNYWKGTASQERTNSVCFDGRYIYAALDMVPAQVVKIDPKTMAVVGTWVGVAGEDHAMAVCSDGTNVYVGLYVTPGKIVKINPATMATILVWTGGAGEDQITVVAVTKLTVPSYLYGCSDTVPAHVFQINPVTMTTVATWTGGAGQDTAYALTVHENTVAALVRIFVGLYVSPGVVISIDPATMLTAATWTGGAGEDFVSSLAWDSAQYLYAALGTFPAQVIKISNATFTTLDKWTGITETMNVGMNIIVDNGYLYLALSPSTKGRGVVAKIDPISMSQVGLWITDIIDAWNCGSLATDGTYIYAGMYGSTTPAGVRVPAYVVRFSLPEGGGNIPLREVPVNINAVNASQTNVFNITSVVGYHYIVEKLRLKAVDPGLNTITVRLFELINGVLTQVDSFDITTANFTNYFSLMDLFGIDHLAGDNLKVTVQCNAGGPYAVTGSYAYRSA